MDVLFGNDFGPLKEISSFDWVPPGSQRQRSVRDGLLTGPASVVFVPKGRPVAAAVVAVRTGCRGTEGTPDRCRWSIACVNFDLERAQGALSDGTSVAVHEAGVATQLAHLARRFYLMLTAVQRARDLLTAAPARTIILAIVSGPLRLVAYALVLVRSVQVAARRWLLPLPTLLIYQCAAAGVALVVRCLVVVCPIVSVRRRRPHRPVRQTTVVRQSDPRPNPAACLISLLPPVDHRHVRVSLLLEVRRDDAT